MPSQQSLTSLRKLFSGPAGSEADDKSAGSDASRGQPIPPPTEVSRRTVSYPNAPAQAVRETTSVANWKPLREALGGVVTSRTFEWDEVEALVGQLPERASTHRGFWSGARTAWSGFCVTAVTVGERVTFVRESPRHTSLPLLSEAAAQSADPSPVANGGRIILVTCVKEKLHRPAAARDFYISPLFRKERAYAEESGLPWYILSAEHGLVAPDEWLAPYERYLPDTTSAYRRAWGTWVIERLDLLSGPLTRTVVEVHASKAYIDAIRAPLAAKGAVLDEPLRGLGLGHRLAWYESDKSKPSPVHLDFARRLRAGKEAVTPAAFVATGGQNLRTPGLYSWWIDDTGAADLSIGLKHKVQPGLIYAGLAGATKWPSGKTSKQTLWSRIKGNHIGGRHSGSTFRLTLGSLLAATHGWNEIDEIALTAWMHDHLRVLALPYEDAATLGRLEHDVLSEIDPPLNLMGMNPSPLRVRLSELRRSYNQR